MTAYHNVGIESSVSALKMESYRLPAANGYQHLSNGMHGTTSDAIAIRYVSNQRSTTQGHDSNSSPETYRSGVTSLPKPPPQTANVELDLQMQPAPLTEIFTGDAPSRSSLSPVPFVIVRRSGTSAAFATLLSISDEGSTDVTRRITLTQTTSGRYQIDGPSFSDSFLDENNFDFQHHVK